MLVRDGRHPVRSNLPKFSSTPTNEVCICALEAVESLYRDNGWVGVGTQSSLGYRVDTYEATAYLLGDAILGHVLPPKEAREVGQKARKCRRAVGEAGAAAKVAKKAARRAGKDEEAAAAAARASIMQRPVQLPLPSVQRCVAWKPPPPPPPPPPPVPRHRLSDDSWIPRSPEPDTYDGHMKADLVSEFGDEGWLHYREAVNRWDDERWDEEHREDACKEVDGKSS